MARIMIWATIANDTSHTFSGSGIEANVIGVAAITDSLACMKCFISYAGTLVLLRVYTATTWSLAMACCESWATHHPTRVGIPESW